MTEKCIIIIALNILNLAACILYICQNNDKRLSDANDVDKPIEEIDIISQENTQLNDEMKISDSFESKEITINITNPD